MVEPEEEFNEELEVDVNGVSVNEQEGESFVEQVQTALEKGREGVVKAKQAEIKKVSHKPTPIRSSQVDTRRAVASFQERRKALRNKKGDK